MQKTTENFAKTGAFTVAFATEDTVVACDYVGVESANKVPNKFEKAGFTAEKVRLLMPKLFRNCQWLLNVR